MNIKGSNFEFCSTLLDVRDEEIAQDAIIFRFQALREIRAAAQLCTDKGCKCFGAYASVNVNVRVRYDRTSK